MINMLVVGEHTSRLLLFGDLPKFYGTLKSLLTQDHMGLEISKRYSSTVFYPMSFMGTLATVVEYRLLFFLANVLKILWYFEVLTWESMEKS